MAQEDRKLFWNRENEVDEKWIQFVDNNVLAGETLRDGYNIAWQLIWGKQSSREALKSMAFPPMEPVIGRGQP